MHIEKNCLITRPSFYSTQREPDDSAESYSEYKTDHSDYVEDDVEIPPESDLDKATEFVDETLITHNLENIESGLIKIRDGFLMAASGYEDICKELPNLDPVEVPQLMKQVPIPQLTEHSKPFQQLLSKTSEKTIIQKFVQQLLSEGQSINNINKEFTIPYNHVYEIAHGTKKTRRFTVQKKENRDNNNSQEKENLDVKHLFSQNSVLSGPPHPSNVKYI